MKRLAGGAAALAAVVTPIALATPAQAEPAQVDTTTYCFVFGNGCTTIRSVSHQENTPSGNTIVTINGSSTGTDYHETNSSQFHLHGLFKQGQAHVLSFRLTYERDYYYSSLDGPHHCEGALNYRYVNGAVQVSQAYENCQLVS